MFSLVLIDEVWQLEGRQAEHILKLCRMCEKLPALGFTGDRGQMAGYGNIRPWHSRLWSLHTWTKELFQVYCCKDLGYQIILESLRTSLPDDTLLQTLQQRCVWVYDPTTQAVSKVLHAHPNTTTLTCTTQGAYIVNCRALEALFPYNPPRAVLQEDVETNPANYVKENLNTFRDLQPRVPD